MKHNMKKNLRIYLILAILLFTAAVAIFWASNNWSLPPPRPPPPPSEPPGEEVQLFFTIHIVISTMNVALSIILLVTYIMLYRKVQLFFTMGLIIFSLVLLLYAITSNPMIFGIFGFQAFGLGPFAFLPDAFTFIALLVLLYLTFKY